MCEVKQGSMCSRALVDYRRTYAHMHAHTHTQHTRTHTHTHLVINTLSCDKL